MQANTSRSAGLEPSFELPLIETLEERFGYEQRLAGAARQIERARIQILCLRVQEFFDRNPEIRAARFRVGPGDSLLDGLRADFDLAGLSPTTHPTPASSSSAALAREARTPLFFETHADHCDELCLILGPCDEDTLDGHLIERANALESIGSLLLGPQAFHAWQARVERARIERALPAAASSRSIASL